MQTTFALLKTLRFFVLTLCAVWACGFPASAAGAPVAQWSFGAEEGTPLLAIGGVHRDQPGPRPPTFPDFEANNTAVKFDGSGARFVFADTGPNSPLDFTNGDALTIEAWVKVDDLNNGENSYIIGKGRTYTPGFARDNQNWALRLREANERACVSFLFATKPQPGKADAHWHRWTTSSGFAPGSGWHHVAVAYRFGQSQSIRAWIDGKPQNGVWDMGGASDEAPVVDDDAVWIASSMGGNAGNSFRGSLDEIAIYREILDDATLAARYRRVGPEPAAPVNTEAMPLLENLPAGRVLATFHEGLAGHDRWPASDALPEETARWTGTTFLLPRLPLRYDDWGIRAGWKAPVLLRLAADVNLPAGKQRFLIRSRGLSRLWINGTLVARTTPHGGSSDGHEAVTPPNKPPLPGLSAATYGDREAFGEMQIPADGRCRVVYEAVVGGKRLRAETGDLCVALQTPDGQSFSLLQSSDAAPIPLTDAAFEAARERTEAQLAALDTVTRRLRAAGQDVFWQKRHDVAREWVKNNPAPAVPRIAGAPHPIDAFLADKIARARQAAVAGDNSFHTEILPILQTQCFRCHGEKNKGGLRLNSREAALLAGDSGKAAIVAGQPQNSEFMRRIRSADEAERMPPTGHALSAAQIAALEKWIQNGAPWPAAPLAAADLAAPPRLDDAAFLRRVYFDTVGVPPTGDEVRKFLDDKSGDKRERAIDRLLDDPRWADHWVSYWQDVLAENPNILKPSLNNSGPFRWYLYEALLDNKSLDRMASELTMLRGSEREGGSAGFGLAADNDAPFAAKSHVLAGAFLGIELQCARCHDSPYHSTKQRDLYALSAMMSRKSVTVPKSSTVPAAFFAAKARQSLIKVTLQPGEAITPTWPFAQTTGVADNNELDALLQNPKDTRERLAALLTAPQNTRFAQVAANRVWKRLMGAGLVEPAHDWEGHAASHPALLDYLAREFVAHDYSVKHLAKLIMTSQTYARAASGQNRSAPPETRFFIAPERRRLSAEQVVDALYAASGQRMETEELTFDPDSRRPADTMISLGYPRRAWMLSTLSNERDRPSLSLPRAQAVTDVLEAFGWTGSRQNPRTDREDAPHVLQPGVLANSTVSTWITRASQGSELADLAVSATSPAQLTDDLFLRFLGRLPQPAERAACVALLSEGFATRLVPQGEIKQSPPLPPLARVSWSNHLVGEANTIKIEMERRARLGAPPDPRLQSAWREAYEDVVWSLINHRDFVWLP